jgi:hypothetical protein
VAGVGDAVDGNGADERSGAPSAVDYTMTALESFCVRLFDASRS